MHSLPIWDIGVLVIYLLAMVGIGFYFSKKNKNSAQFTKASGSIPGWAVGLSIYATFLSSNTFIGVPGKAYGTNWNAFVFSISLPFAAWVGSKYFVPFYRRTGEVSAYMHLEHRFGPWARTYVVICFLLTQLARIGSIFFGVALCLQALTGFSMFLIMLVTGICIIVYTVLGGMEAIIWTDVTQAIVLTLGALIILFFIIAHTPGGIPHILRMDISHHKFSLGSLSLNFTSSTFWVIFLYGFFINLNNFGIDQNYVQRYHTAKSAKSAAKSVWLCVWMYVPVSLLFFIIGSFLFAYYQIHPALLYDLKHQVAKTMIPGGSDKAIAHLATSLKPSDYGDKVLPHFIVNKIPEGVTGLIIAAILSAAMSTISSGMNASATVFSMDIFKRYIKPNLSDRQMMHLLYIATAVVGLLGMGSGIAMIGVKSILDIWWELSGIFAGGMLGLFLLGIISRRTRNHEALTATIIGVIVILWMTFSNLFPKQYAFLRNPLQDDMIIVIGTLSILLTGMLLTKWRSLSGSYFLLRKEESPK